MITTKMLNYIRDYFLFSLRISTSNELSHNVSVLSCFLVSTSKWFEKLVALSKYYCSCCCLDDLSSSCFLLFLIVVYLNDKRTRIRLSFTAGFMVDVNLFHCCIFKWQVRLRLSFTAGSIIYRCQFISIKRRVSYAKKNYKEWIIQFKVKNTSSKKSKCLDLEPAFLFINKIITNHVFFQ